MDFKKLQEEVEKRLAELEITVKREVFQGRQGGQVEVYRYLRGDETIAKRESHGRRDYGMIWCNESSHEEDRLITIHALLVENHQP